MVYGSISDLVECDEKEAKPAPLMASMGVTASPTMVEATGSPSTLSTPVSLFPPPGMGGVPQPPVSTKELIIIIFMFGLWAYSLFLTYRFLVLEGAMQDNGNGYLSILQFKKNFYN